jgi:hypothetical protein
MRALTVAVVAAVGLVAWSAWRIEVTATRVREFAEELDQMQTLVTRWRDAKGVEHSVNTPRQEGESAEEHAARHAAAVAALQAIYPPA